MIVSDRTDTRPSCELQPDAGMLDPVQHSEFWRLMNDEFGAGYTRTVARDQVIAALGGRTVDEAIAAKISLREIWLGLCEVMNVPPQRHWGKDQQDPPSSRP